MEVDVVSTDITSGISITRARNTDDSNLIDSVTLSVDGPELAEGTYAVSLEWYFSVTPDVKTTQTFQVISVDC